MINEGFAFLTVAGFIGWVSMTLLFIFRAFDRDGKFHPKPAVRFGCAIAVFYVLWIIGMLNA